MTRSILGRAAFSAVVALALGIGVREAVAAPSAARARPYCRDDQHCQDICDTMYPGLEPVGICSSGHTCWCYY